MGGSRLSKLFSYFPVKAVKKDTIELSTFGKVKKYFISELGEKDGNVKAQQVKNLAERYDHKLSKNQTNFIKDNKKELIELSKLITAEIKNVSEQNIRGIAYSLMYDIKDYSSFAVDNDVSKPNAAIVKFIHDNFKDNKKEFHAVFYRLLQTDYKKNYFHIGGILEDKEKTISKLQAIGFILSLDSAGGRVDAHDSSIFAIKPAIEKTSNRGMLSGEIGSEIYFSPDFEKGFIKNNKLEETELDREEHKLLSRFELDTDRALVESLKDPIKKSSYTDHTIADNRASVKPITKEDMGSIQQDHMEEIIPGRSPVYRKPDGTRYIKHVDSINPEQAAKRQQIAFARESRILALSPIPEQRVPRETMEKSGRYESLSEVAKATKAKAELQKWQPEINKKSSYTAYINLCKATKEQSIDVSAGEDIGRQGKNFKLPIVIENKTEMLEFPDSNDNAIYQEDINTVIDNLIGLNPELKKLGADIENLRSLIKIAVSRNLISTSYIKSVIEESNIEAMISKGTFFSGYDYEVSIDLANMTVNFLNVRFGVVDSRNLEATGTYADVELTGSKVPAKTPIINVGNLQFKIGKPEIISNEMPLLFSNGLTITDIFHEDKYNKKVNLFSYRLITIDKEMAAIRSGKYMLEISKKIESIKEVINLLKDEIEGAKKLSLTKPDEIQARKLSSFKMLSNVEKFQTQIAKLESELIQLGDGNDSPILTKLKEQRTMIADEIKRIEVGLSIEQFEAYNNLRKNLLSKQKNIEDITIWGGDDGKGVLRLRLNSRISKANLDEKKELEAKLASLERFSPSDMQKLVNGLKEEASEYEVAINQIKVAYNI